MARSSLALLLLLAACASPSAPADPPAAATARAGLHFAVTVPPATDAAIIGGFARPPGGVALSAAPPDVSGVVPQPGGPPDPLNQRADSAGPVADQDLTVPSTRPLSYTALPDGPGGLILRDPQTGEVVRTGVDAEGQSVFNDGHGRVVRCFTDRAGVTICD